MTQLAPVGRENSVTALYLPLSLRSANRTGLASTRLLRLPKGTCNIYCKSTELHCFPDGPGGRREITESAPRENGRKKGGTGYLPLLGVFRSWGN